VGVPVEKLTQLGTKFRIPVEIRHLKREFQLDFDKAINEHAKKPLAILKGLLDSDQALTVIERMALVTLVKAAETGNTRYMDMVLYSTVRKFNKSHTRKKGDKKGADILDNLPDPGDD
jgi:hypothetical protein